MGLNCRSGWGREVLGGPHGGLELVGRPTWRYGSGREDHRRSGAGMESLPEALDAFP